MLQLRSRGVRYAPLGLPVELDRIPCVGREDLDRLAAKKGAPVGGSQSSIKPLIPTVPPWATPCSACVATPAPHHRHAYPSSSTSATRQGEPLHNRSEHSGSRRLQQEAPAGRLRRGEWLSASHDKRYGKAFKMRHVGYWGGTHALVKQANALASKSKDVYEFGVYTGVTMRDMAKRVRGFGRLYGFDSFTGLPNETSGERLEGPHWNPGGFSAADALGEWNLPSLLARLKAKIGYDNTTFVPGYYHETLTSALRRAHPFQPALLVDIDVDLHLSAVECLTWLVEQRLLVPGTLVRYDDWRNMRQRGGEARAHREITRRFNITWRNLRNRKGELNSREWQVISIG